MNLAIIKLFDNKNRLQLPLLNGVYHENLHEIQLFGSLLSQVSGNCAWDAKKKLYMLMQAAKFVWKNNEKCEKTVCSY